MKTIIAGTRDITDIHQIHAAIEACGWNITEVVSGGARGVDSLGEEWARAYDVSLKVFPADWAKHGKAAGPIRNRQMADYAEALIAIWDGRSHGTKNMIFEAKMRGLKVYIHRP